MKRTPMIHTLRVSVLLLVLTNIMATTASADEFEDTFGFTPINRPAANPAPTPAPAAPARPVVTPASFTRNAGIPEAGPQVPPPAAAPATAVATGGISDRPTVQTNQAPLQETQQDLDEQLWLFARAGNLPVVRELVQKGASLNITTRFGETPLHAAATFGHAQVVSSLLAQGANVNASTTRGWTPLHSAARFGRPVVANLLKQRGASSQIRTNDLGNKTPIDMAIDKGDLRLARILGY